MKELSSLGVHQQLSLAIEAYVAGAGAGAGTVGAGAGGAGPTWSHEGALCPPHMAALGTTHGHTALPSGTCGPLPTSCGSYGPVPTAGPPVPTLAGTTGPPPTLAGTVPPVPYAPVSSLSAPHLGPTAPTPTLGVCPLTCSLVQLRSHADSVLWLACIRFTAHMATASPASPDSHGASTESCSLPAPPIDVLALQVLHLLFGTLHSSCIPLRKGRVRSLF